MGTFDSSVFKSKDRDDDSGKTDHLFSHPSDGKDHGHVVSKDDDQGNTSYSYVRDVEGDVYVDDRD